MKKFSISNKLKIASVMLAVIAVFAVSPTLAWLSATTTPVVNYFSGGAIALTLDEAPVDTDGQATGGARVQENHYKYMAGAELDKDPTVTVLANSEDCYVYVCADNELPSSLFSININTTAWTLVSTSGTMTIYRYATSVESQASDQVLTPVFTKVTVSESLTSDDITELGTKTLTVTAFAIQTASLTTDEADGLAEAYFYDGADIASVEADVVETEEDTDGADETEKNESVDVSVASESEEPASEENTVQGSVAESTSKEEESTGQESAVDDTSEETGSAEGDTSGETGSSSAAADTESGTEIKTEVEAE
ncbi:MAG: hypothetical protein LUC83_08700 [Clostridiales bacterium]|nr:hypothetical protein [Clostridiales bacterium]